MKIYESDRLILRRWKSEDLDAFAEMNADPRVMEYFPATLSREESAGKIKINEEQFIKNAFGFLAAELKSTGELAGLIGLNIPRHALPCCPCVEIGWQLSQRFWGKGLAQEGARASLEYGFRELGLAEIVSITTLGNLKSRNVMEKIGMTYDSQGDFDHPNLAEGHPLRRHVLYRIKKP